MFCELHLDVFLSSAQCNSVYISLYWRFTSNYAHLLNSLGWIRMQPTTCVVQLESEGDFLPACMGHSVWCFSLHINFSNHKLLINSINKQPLSKPGFGGCSGCTTSPWGFICSDLLARWPNSFAEHMWRRGHWKAKLANRWKKSGKIHIFPICRRGCSSRHSLTRLWKVQNNNSVEKAWWVWLNKSRFWTLPRGGSEKVKMMKRMKRCIPKNLTHCLTVSWAWLEGRSDLQIHLD